jgi:hypothetical protein
MGRYPYKTKDGKKKRVHRIVMEEFLKRELEPHEHVYHINGDPYDNRIDNLVIIIKNLRVKS